jgi:hypothetical protein
VTTAAEDLRTALLAHAELTALVGQRVRFDMGAETDICPFLVLRQVGNSPERGLDGTLHARRETFQVESWGDTRSQSATVHAAVEAALAAAEIWPDEADPDALDPEVGARACVWNVDIWT